MGRRGRHAFLDHWHRRELVLPDGDTLRWVLMAPPERAPLAECFRRTSPDGSSRGVHATEALRLLAEHGHRDTAHVRTDTFVGRSLSR